MEQAIKLWRGNERKAQERVQAGQRCANGEGTLTDYTAAARWYERAARQGYAQGQYELAKCYFQGAGVAQDYKKAQELLNEASRSYFPAFRMLRQYYPRGDLQMQPDFSRFPGLQVRAAKGEPVACAAMGNCFFTGIVGYRDYVAAAHWYGKGAENGEPEAQFCLGYAYITGAGVTQDPHCGFSWLEKAAKQDFVPAIHNLMVCYACGCGTKPDSVREAILGSRLENRAVGNTQPGKLYSPEDLWTDRQIDKLTNILYSEDDDKGGKHYEEESKA